MRAAGGVGVTARQLPLPLRLETFARLETFVAGPNATLVAHVAELASGRRRDIVWCWGGAGAGKSHLLQAVCREAGHNGLRTMYVPLARAADFSPDVIADLEAVDLVAVDDVTAVVRDPVWERGLFSLLETFQVRRGALLLAAPVSPAAADFELADLASRAAGGVVYRLEALDDEGRREALVAHARFRGLELEAAAAEYLLNRVARDMRALCTWLERLDRAALVARRRITVPFIRETLESGG